MRISVIFNSDGDIVLPVQYNHILQGFMYKNLGNKDYSQLLHYSDNLEEKKRFKLFTFSRLLGKFQFNKETGRIAFSPPFEIVVSSPVDSFISDLAETLMQSELNFLGQNEVEVKGIHIHKELEFEQKVQIKMISPVVACTVGLRDDRKYTHYYSPWHPQFTELVKINLLSKYRMLHGVLPPVDEFQVIPNGSQEKKFEKILNYKGTVIKGYAGIYWLKGCPELIKTAYDTGLGSRNSQGFGCWEVKG